MPLDFPASPTLNQQYTLGSRTWEWDGTAWNLVNRVVGYTGSLGYTGSVGFTETVYTITDGASVDLNPANGTIQVWTLGASRSPTANNFLEGQSITLMIDDGTARTITWPSVVWVGNVAPTLSLTGYTVIELWKVGTTLYGALTGSTP